MNVTKLVLTGGPCAGKTSALSFLAEKLRASGYYPLIAHEAATAVLSSGLTYLDANGDWFPFQRAVVRHAISTEGILENTLRDLSHEKPVIICDRGIMDSMAYMTAEQFRSVIESEGLRNPSMIRDGRYDAVIHLRSTAIGAPEFFSSATNVHRWETIAEAVAADERTLAAWIGHQHLAIVGNTYGDFGGKLEAVWKHACRLLGIPEPREIEKKYLVEPIDFKALGIPHAMIDVEQYYLALPDENEKISRVRSWGQNGAETYTLTRKRLIVPGEVEEIEEHISEMVYAQYTKYRRPGTVPIRKRRTCFVYNDQYFMYDEFLTGRLPGLTLVEIELESQDTPVFLPPFVSVREDVSLNKEYSNSIIAEAAK